MLFAATERAVFVYSPWGWNRIWSSAADIKVQALGVIQSANQEVLLVGTDEALWEISWQRGAERRSAWAVFHYEFHVRAIEQKRHSGIRAIYRNNDESLARGYALDDSGQLIPIEATTDIKLGAPIHVPGAQPSVIWSSGPNGWSFAWGYTASTLLTLNPSGREASRIDLESTLEPARTRQRGITCVFADTVRRRLYVGSDFGMLVGDFKPDSYAPSGSFFRIEALGLATVETVAVVAGRLVSVSKEPFRFDAKSPETNIVIEADSSGMRDAAAFGRNAKFRSAVPPSNASLGVLQGAAQVDSDTIWLEASEQIWQWTPELLTALPPVQNAHGQKLSLFRTKRPRDRPQIATDLLGETLFACTPNGSFWSTYSIGEGFSLARLVPDPGSFGFWALERVPDGIAGTYGYTRFLTPHGAFSTTADGTQYGNQPFTIRRLNHDTPDGRTYWPISEQGGLLLPAGQRWIYAKSGQWHVIDAPANPEINDLTPGADSSATAWLGLVKSGEAARVTRLDAAPGLERLVFTTTKIGCGGDPSLVPDDEGKVWLACGSANGWVLRRVHKLSDESDNEIKLAKLPDKPVYLFHAPLRIYVLTARGVIEAPRSGQSNWIELLPAVHDGEPNTTVFDSVSVPFVRSAISVPATWTALANRVFSLPRSQTRGPAFLLSISAQSASISPISDDRGSRAAALAAMLAETSEIPGAMVWSLPGANAGTSVEWYKARQGQPTATSSESLPDLSGAEDAARSGGIIAITDGSRVAFRALPPNLDDVHAPLYVPISITFRYRNGKSDSFNLTDRFPPERLSAGVSSAELRVMPDYEDWWRGGLSSVEYRTLPGEAWQRVNSEGVANFPLQSGRPYILETRSPDRFGLGSLPLRPLPFRVDSEPRNVPGWTYAISGASIIVLVLAASRRARRFVLTVLGRRWVFATKQCDYTVTVRSFDHSVRIEINAPGFAEPREYLGQIEVSGFWPPQIEGFQQAIGPASNVRVRVDEALFFQPWSQFLGGQWSKGPEAVIAGQVAAVQPRRPRPPFYARRLRVSVLACSSPGRGFPPLRNVPIEIQNVRARFKNWGAEVIEVSPAVAVDFIEAIRSSDIVHVAAHATLSTIEFADRAVMVADITAELLASARCRLLVLSACDAGRMDSGSRSLVFELIRAGVNTIAAAAPVDTVVCKAFLEELYGAMLPSRKARDIAVADAIRYAAACCQSRFSSFAHHDWTKTVDAFVLYGDPTLRVNFESPPKGAVHDSFENNSEKDPLAKDRR
jgi:CHAT domain